MTGTILLALFNSLLYCACTSLIRYPLCHDQCQCSLSLHLKLSVISIISRFIYVRSSLQENIQRVLKRNSFTFSFLALGLFISIFNVAGELHLKRFCRTNDNQFFQCSFTSRESKQELTVWGLSSTEPAWILSLAGAPPSSR